MSGDCRAHSNSILDKFPVVDLPHQTRHVQRTSGFLGDQEQISDHRPGVLDLLFGLLETQDEFVAFALARRASARLHHRTQPLRGLGLRLLRERVQHVHDLVDPAAALLIACGMEIRERRPRLPTCPLKRREGASWPWQGRLP